LNIITKILFGLTTIFLIAVIALTFIGDLTFGYGLGDLFYLMFTGFALLIVTVTYFATKRIDFNKKKLTGGLISIGLVLVMFVFVRLVTVDRGSEYKWDGHIFLSSSYADREKKEIEEYQNELTRLDKLIEKNQNDHIAFYDKGLHLRKNGNWEKSSVEFENSIKIKPTFDAYYECAYSYSNIGQYKTAIDLYQKAADLDTTNTEVRKRIKNLKEYHRLD
jgi:tetratricopeptide (TPR) repeat protein